MSKRHLLTLLCLLGLWVPAAAQEFFNLGADEVRIDSALPRFEHAIELGSDYARQGYDVSIDYPEFIDMSAADVARYQCLRRDTVPSLPVIDHYVGVSRRRGTLYLSFTPIVFRDGRFQKLVSFKLGVQPKEQPAASRPMEARQSPLGADSVEARYASHSVLATGRWAKIRVAQTGIHQLTESVIRKAGFSNLDKVRIYGYGGALQPEKLTADYLAQTDDLHEVATVSTAGRKLFWGVGPVNWSSINATTRTRNPYSDYGYYFITEGDEEPLTIDAATFSKQTAQDPSLYHTLHEVDDYAWYHGGRNLYEGTAYTIGSPRRYTLSASEQLGWLTVVLTYNGPFEATIEVNGQQVGTASSSSVPGSYTVAMSKTWTFTLEQLQASNTIAITQNSGSTVRLDYLAITSSNPQKTEDLENGSFPEAEYVYNITNQDHHADTAADLIIVIPTSQKLLEQAERLKQLHEQQDTMRVRIVPADELYNEFSSGTPDANAYRRYLKMLYDRAETEADMPNHLLLFGDAAWDNRMLSTNWRTYSPDDFLLCYESEESLSETDCYVTDDYFCMLDDNEGGDMKTKDRADVGVGRLTARNAEEAKVLVDKIYSYRLGEQSGAWQNTLCFMADDGNGNDQNQHMADADKIVGAITNLYSGYLIKKIYWDAYTRQTSATGNSYPDVRRLIKQQMQDGALVMNYTGHGNPSQLSHEQCVILADFAESTSLRLPFWVTASCDTSPFDTQLNNLGETAMLNKNGGAIAFFGTPRTVYEDRNLKINRSLMRHIFSSVAGKRITIGEAVRLAKNGLITSGTSDERDLTLNKLNYVLLGDPALALATPQRAVVIDSIDGQPATSQALKIAAGSKATISGHVDQDAEFNGTVTITVRDVEETVVCKLNYQSVVEDPFVFKDRPSTLYQGANRVTNGRFNCTFAVPKDISYSEATGQIVAYAVSDDKSASAHGESANFYLAGEEDAANDGVGPNIYCYLNNASFTNGGTVNTTPYFYAELSDKDGINAAGNGIGHNMELVVDGDVGRTYQLNNYFQFDFGDYQRGSVGYSLPELDAGTHRLLFRAWDVLNNSSVAQLTFVVDPEQRPTLKDVVCTRNPAVGSTSFVISHDRTGSQVDVTLEVFDPAGRKLWQHSENGVAAGQTYTVDWDLTTSSGKQLGTGVYLYRVHFSSDGSSEASAARKLIIMKK